MERVQLRAALAGTFFTSGISAFLARRASRIAAWWRKAILASLHMLTRKTRRGQIL